jgi:hypothetical protein
LIWGSNGYLARGKSGQAADMMHVFESVRAASPRWRAAALQPIRADHRLLPRIAILRPDNGRLCMDYAQQIA